MNSRSLLRSLHPASRIALLGLFLAQAHGTVEAAEPFSLDECIAYGLEHAPDILQTRYRLTNQLYRTTIERAAFDPRIGADTDINNNEDRTTYRTTLSDSLPAGIDLSASASTTDDEAADQETDRYILRASKTLLGDGSYLESVRGVRDSVDDEAIRRNTLALEERRLVSQIKSDYYEIIRNQQTLRIQQLRVERSKRNLEGALLREDPLDIATARLQVPEDEISVIRARQAVSNSLESLKVRIGMPVEDPFAIDSQFRYLPAAVDVDDAIQYALEEHELIRIARRERTKLERAARIANRKPWPVLRVGAQHVIEEPEGEGSESDTRFDVSLDWPLGARADRYRRYQSLLSLAIQDEEIFSTLQQREQTLRRLGRQLDEAQTAVELQEQRIGIGERRLELFTDRWENGEIDILELIRSQNDLENNRVQLVNLKTTYMELLAQFEFESGLPVSR